MRDWLMPICGEIIGAAVLGALVMATNSYVNDPNRTNLFGVTDSSNQSEPSGRSLAPANLRCCRSWPAYLPPRGGFPFRQ